MSWLTDKEAMSPESIKARAFDYFTTFYGTEASRRVWAEIREHARDLPANTPEAAIAKLAVMDLLQEIKTSCGISDEEAIVSAEMGTKQFTKTDDTNETKELLETE